MATSFERRSGPRGSAQRIEHRGLDTLRPYPGNARTHSAKQVQKLAASISHFGFVVPVVINADSEIIAGHGRVEAAKSLGLGQVPCLRIEHLSQAQQRAYRLADNRLAELACWDEELLAKELHQLAELDLDFSLDITGFDIAEIDFEDDHDKRLSDPADEVAPPSNDQPAVTRSGDLWLLGKHKLLCGDPLQSSSFERLMGRERAHVVFTSLPRDVLIGARGSGLEGIPQRDVATAGKTSLDDYARFLGSMCAALVEFTVDGGMHFLCVDWRHAKALLIAADPVYSELADICVWNEGDGRGGSLYRSAHELIFVWKAGTAPHIDNARRSRSRRARTNVWNYARASSERTGSADELAAQPAVKPVALVADAIRDCSKRGAIVLDPLAGAGTTLIAAEKTARRAATIERDPLCVDAAIRRWQNYTGKSAVHADSGATFADRPQAERAVAPSTNSSS